VTFVLAVLLIAASLYAVLCTASPNGPCRTCRGFGFKTRTDRKGRTHRGRTCRRCKGHGTRTRIGRRLFDLTATPERDQTR
jgi:type II secretory ATPase GspE/PulE/Tfp pilus assembly ATPase PilB-like protein